MRVLIYQYIDGFEDDCDNARSQELNDGILQAYQKLTNDGLTENTFDDLICSDYSNVPQELTIDRGGVVFYDSSTQPYPTALFKLSSNEITVANVRDIIIRMNGLTPVSGSPGFYQEPNGNIFSASDSIKNGGCPKWIPVFLRSTLCSQYGCPKWVPSFLCENKGKFFGLLILILVLIVVLKLLRRK